MHSLSMNRGLGNNLVLRVYPLQKSMLKLFARADERMKAARHIAFVKGWS